MTEKMLEMPGFAIPEEYELLQCEQLEDVHCRGSLLIHKKSGARVVAMETEDENKVFTIGFRTPPKNSTGVAHILEHCVLCGSKNYPLKDPFVELVKGSMNTFLNAMTYPDKTIYPVASCNDQDFANLMAVYMDAVFYPNIYKEEKIFRQEGWHYHLENETDPLTLNGVVYNEMKGVFSSADDIISREVFNTMFPDTPYGVESGGDPNVIPELTYEEFLDFHRTYYHPANSYIYLYGNMDMTERLSWMNENYLKDFERITVDSAIPMQKPFEAPIQRVIPYPVMDDDPLEDNTYLTCSYGCGTSLDTRTAVALQIIDYVLFSSPGAPIKQRLLDEGIGKDVSGSMETDVFQPFYSVSVRQSNEGERERFLSILQEEFERAAREGLDPKAVEAGINMAEFMFREADFGGYPKGLIYGINLFGSWLYDDAEPFKNIKLLEHYRDMRRAVGTGYFEELIRRYFIENTYRALLLGVPTPGLQAEKEAALTRQMADYKASLSQQEIADLVTFTRELKAYQETPDSPEALSCIKLLKRSDLKREVITISNIPYDIEGTTLLRHDIFTNGIRYMKLIFDISRLPDEYIPYLELLASVLGGVDTEHYTFNELNHAIDANCGGMHFGLTQYDGVKHNDFTPAFEVRAKGLYPQNDFIFAMIKEILFTSKLDDTKRIREILARQNARSQSALSSAGHNTARLRVLSAVNKSGAFRERTTGLTYARMVKELCDNFDERKSQICDRLKEMMTMIFRPENLLVSLTCDEAGMEGMAEAVISLKAMLYTNEVQKGEMSWQPRQIAEGLSTPGQVQYVCKAGDFLEAGLEYSGALRVLRVMMGYEYLWSNIRVTGGAYGCMSGYLRDGTVYMVSYRDPHLKRTLEVFDRAADFLENFEADERTMDQYVIGTCSDLDRPLTPAAYGESCMAVYFTGVTDEERQISRDQVLDVTPADIRALAPIIRTVMDQNQICVVGSEAALKKHEELFTVIEKLV